MKFNTLLAFGLIVLFSTKAFATIYEVTNADGNVWWPASGDPGSLKEAFTFAAANPGRDTIRFNLPVGTTVSAALNPMPLDATNSDLLIDGASTQGGGNLTLALGIDATGSNIDFVNIDFQLATNAIKTGNGTHSITNCTFDITGASQDAILIGGGAVTMSGLDIQSVGKGINMTGGTHSITNCTLNASGVSQEAILIGGGTVTMATIDIQSVGTGIKMNGGTHSLDYCTLNVSGNGQDGIWINGGSGTVVTNCTITGATQHAITIDNSGGHTIDNCSVTNFGDVGFIARGSGGNTFKNCTAFSGQHNGIGLKSANNVVEDCTTYDNDYSGIAVDNSTGLGSGNIIRRNKVYGNNKVFYMGTSKPLYDQAALFSNGPDTEVYDNYVYDNAAHGIMINGALASNSVVRDNIVGRDDSGNELGNGWNGIYVHSGNGSLIEGNTVVNNGSGSSHTSYYMPEAVSGIRVESVTSGTIQDNYVGTDANKTEAGNAFDGITLYTNTSGVTVDNNVTCNNGFYDFDTNTPHALWDGSVGGGGIALRTGSGNNVNITSNFVGVHRDNSAGGNKDYGISVEGGSNATIGGTDAADGNTIGNSTNSFVQGTSRGTGIWLFGASSTTVLNNDIFDNGGNGIQIEGSATSNVIGADGDGNSINRNNIGILVSGSSANNNTLRYNSFSCNTGGGIQLQSDGNTDYGNGSIPKAIVIRSDDPRANFVSGYAPSASAVVDIYATDATCPAECTDSVNQGVTMVATVTASSTLSSNGLYEWEYDFVAGGNQVNRDNAIVLATEQGVAGSVNTSEFSVCHLECDTPMNSVINSADFDFCPGESTTLTANSFGMGSSGYTYQWYLGSVNSVNLVNTAIDDSTYNTSTGGDYYVVISYLGDPETCRDTTTLGTVIANLNPTVNVLSSAENACSNSLTDVTIDANASGSNLQYLWTPGLEASSSITVQEAGNYSVTVTNTVTGCEESDEVTLSQSNAPAVSMSDIFFCQNDSALVSAGLSGMSYSWSPSGNTTESFYVYSSGTHRLEVSDPSTGCIARDTVEIEQSPEPTPFVELTDDSLFICPTEGDEIELIATVTTNLTGDLVWSDGTVDEASIIATDSINYSVTFTDTYGCSGGDSVKIYGECIPPDPELPNVITRDSPWRPIGEITSEQVLDGTSTLIVYDRWGLIMFESTDKLPEWTGSNTKELPCSAGVYFWIWEFTDNTETVRRYNGFVQLLTEE